MYDLFAWFMGVLQGVISGAVGGLILLWFIFPRMGTKTATQTLKAAKKDPEIAPLIKKAQEIIHVLEPLVKQFKNFDLEKTQKDIRPFIEMAKKIDPKKVGELIDSVKEVVDGFKARVTEKPNVPTPDPEKLC